MLPIVNSQQIEAIAVMAVLKIQHSFTFHITFLQSALVLEDVTFQNSGSLQTDSHLMNNSLW